MKAPKEIYIQTEDDDIGDIWTDRKINESDQRYIRDDLVLMRSDMIKHAIGPEHYSDETP